MGLPITDTIIVALSKLVDDAQVDSREPTHSELKTECLPFHPFGSKTLNVLLKDVHNAITTDLSPNYATS